MRLSVEGRFWSKVDVPGPDPKICWLWTGAKGVKGQSRSKPYGSFWDGTRTVEAHRWSYQHLYGELPPNVQVDHRHTCSKLCVNPFHLRAVTNKQNNENLPGAKAGSPTGIRGVFVYTDPRYPSRRPRYRAAVTHNRRQLHVGYFDTLEAAEAAVIAKRNELFTHNDKDRA